MAPGNSKSAGKFVNPKSKTNSSKGKKRRSSEKTVPKRKLPDAVREFAEKRNIEVADDDSDEGTKKPAKKRRKPVPSYDDFVPREMPIPRDYGAGFAAKSTAHLTWGAPILFQPVASFTEQASGRPSSSGIAKGKGKARRKGKRAASPCHPFLTDSEDDDATPVPESRRSTTRRAKTSTTPDIDDTLPGEIFFMKFPAEIRMEIYRHLLVAGDPVQVRQGWSTLYPRNRPCLETSILRVSRQVRNEAINVLYGKNVFLYLLRETAAVPVSNDPDGLADDHFVEYDGESDPEYDEEVPVTGANRDPQVEIDIKRFGHKFRRIKILAEPNRYEKGYLQSMANAISVFRNLKPIKCRIHTIEVEITPRLDKESGGLSFLNFFEKSSPVMKELRGLPCQFIEIVVNTSSETQERIKVNLKYAANVRRARRGEHPLRDDDEAMQKYTSEEAGAAQGLLDNLGSSIQKLWDAQNQKAEKEEDSEQEGENEEAVEWLWGQDYN
ncbi:hypothetical protein CkaCkLH20_07553 [Colletotrichum karsti]|uniref:Uncharacterized protein n=1 Tax=Colletotrichum karsti TaxID=1095194 RepID=A0A9P6LG60_9PEZI|nr:uncharacterized protein CkaCkLH20_07553 [Colletotrichum karsti]KAF9874859.1 hypothetical protein CkaCkLH20_07553 [Colletotrichum karsti]